MRISARVVRGKIVFPDGHPRKLYNRAHHALDKLRVIEQEQRHGRIADVYRGDTTVGAALLGKKQKVPRTVFYDFMRRHGLPQSGAENIVIIFSERLRPFLQVLVKGKKPFVYYFVFAPHRLQRLQNRMILQLISLTEIAEIIDGNDIVEAE